MPARMEDLLVEVERLLEHGLSEPTGRGGLRAVLRAELAVRRDGPTHLLRLERRLVRLEHDVVQRVDVEYPEVVVVRACQHVPSRPPYTCVSTARKTEEEWRRCALIVPAPRALELVEDAVVLVQITQLPAEVVVDRDRLDRLAVHVDVPDLEREVVAREDVPPVVAELDVRDRRDDLGEERAVRVFLLFEHCIVRSVVG